MKILYGLLAFLALLVVAAFLAPSFLDWERLKPEIEARVEAATGRTLHIDGDIAIALLPTPRLTVADLRLANLPGAAAPEMARIDSADLTLALGPLMGGDIEITHIALVEPVLELERLADGRPNWVFEPAAGETGGERGEKRAAVRIDSVAVTGGAVVLRSHGGRPLERIEGIDADFTARSPQGPFRGEGRFILQGAAVDFRLITRALDEDGALPASLELAMASGLGSAIMEGILRRPRATPTFEGTLRVKGPDLRAALDAFSFTPDGAPPSLDGGFSLRAEIRASEEATVARDIQARLGDGQATGEISWRDGAPASLDGTLAVNRIDLDALLAAFDAEEGEAAADAAAGAGNAPSVAALPQGLTASLDLAIDAVIYRGDAIRQVRALLELEDGVVAVRQASALLPAGADVSLVGRMTAGMEGPRFDGVADMTADDLRSVLSWLAVDLDAVPHDRLRRFTASADLALEPDRLVASNIDLSVDATHIVGRLDMALDERPRIAADLSATRINVGAYLPTGGGAAAEPAARGENGEGQPLLDRFDADIALRIATLIHDGVPLHDLAAHALLQNGTLTLHNLSVGDAAGARLAVRGTVGTLADTPSAALDFEARLPDMSEVVRIVGLAPNAAVARLGALSLGGAVEGDAETLTVTLDGRAAGLDVVLNGRLMDPFGAPSYSGAFDLRHPDAASFVMRATGAAHTALPPGALHVSGRVAGGEAAADISGIEARIGESSATGEILVLLSQDPLFFDADLHAETFDLGIIGAGIAAAGVSGWEARRTSEARRRGRWSDTPFDLAFLRQFDASLKIESPALILGEDRLEDARLHLAVADGALALRTLEGRLFGGGLEAEGSLDPERAAELAFRLADFDLAQAMERLAGAAALGGRATLEGRLATDGTSERAMIRTLRGEVSVVTQGGALEGVDLAELGRALEAPGAAGGFAAVAAGALSSGRTPIRALDGTLRVADGGMRFDTLAIEMEDATAALNGRIDLSAWRIDLDTTFRLTAHPEAPPAGLILEGAIDRPERRYRIAEMQAWLERTAAQEAAAAGDDRRDAKPDSAVDEFDTPPSDGGRDTVSEAPAAEPEVPPVDDGRTTRPETAPEGTDAPVPKERVGRADDDLPAPADETPDAEPPAEEQDPDPDLRTFVDDLLRTLDEEEGDDAE